MQRAARGELAGALLEDGAVQRLDLGPDLVVVGSPQRHHVDERVPLGRADARGPRVGKRDGHPGVWPIEFHCRRDQRTFEQLHSSGDHVLIPQYHQFDHENSSRDQFSD